MRPIDGDALIVAMLDHGVDHVQTDDLEEINQIINDAPTVDAMPVVRCGECRYWNNTGRIETFGFCQSPGIMQLRRADWYCKEGDRKEDAK